MFVSTLQYINKLVKQKFIVTHIKKIAVLGTRPKTATYSLTYFLDIYIYSLERLSPQSL